MNYTIIYELEAEISLFEIAKYYINTAGFEVAEQVIQSIEIAIQSLEVMPNRCPNTEFSEHIKKFSIPNLPYIAFYTVQENTVYVLEIIHGSRNQNFLYEKYKNS